MSTRRPHPFAITHEEAETALVEAFESGGTQPQGVGCGDDEQRAGECGDRGAGDIRACTAG